MYDPNDQKMKMLKHKTCINMYKYLLFLLALITPGLIASGISSIISGTSFKMNMFGISTSFGLAVSLLIPYIIFPSVGLKPSPIPGATICVGLVSTLFLAVMGDLSLGLNVSTIQAIVISGGSYLSLRLIISLLPVKKPMSFIPLFFLVLAFAFCKR